MRRFFRIGLRLGLLAATGVAVLKLVQSRRSRTGDSSVEAPSWPPLQEAAVAPEPSAQTVADAPAPVVTRSTSPAPPAPAPEAAAPAPPVEPATTTQLWVEPEDGVCPATHPVKAKLSSNLFHLPGMVAYNRLRPDRCYPDEASALKDGLTKAKR